MTKEELYQDLEELIYTVAKFKTHRNSKTFFRQMKQILEEYLSPPDKYRAGSNDIVRPNPNGKGPGYVVMTEGTSGRVDEVRKQTYENKQ